MRNAVLKRVNEGKDIKEISEELCDGLKYPKRKIINIIKETKGIAYLTENKVRLGYRGGGGDKPKKAKKNEVQNFAVQQTETNLPECDEIKKQFMQLIKECHKAHPNDWKQIILKCIKDFEAALLNSNDLTQISKQEQEQEQTPSDVTSSTAQGQEQTSPVVPSTSETASSALAREQTHQNPTQEQLDYLFEICRRHEPKWEENEEDRIAEEVNQSIIAPTQEQEKRPPELEFGIGLDFNIFEKLFEINQRYKAKRKLLGLDWS